MADFFSPLYGREIEISGIVKKLEYFQTKIQIGILGLLIKIPVSKVIGMIALWGYHHLMTTATAQAFANIAFTIFTLATLV